jgi:polar amino acid transport system permease protein
MLDILQNNWKLFLIGQYPHGPLGGLAITIILSVLGLVLAFPLSILVALARVSPMAIFYWPATALVYLVRGVPLIMFIFWVYFFIPLLIGRNVTGFTTMLCTLVIYQSAYMAEVVRAGIQALAVGQVEAARALGLSYLQTTRRVILPQALYNMLPALVSQLVAIIKETSLASVISVEEMTFSATQVNTNEMTRPFQVFAILALTYYVLCFTLSQFASFLERRIARRRTPFAQRPRDPVDLGNAIPPDAT